MLLLALFLLGIGLLLTGIKVLSDALKRMGIRTFRRLALRYMTPRWKALSLGVGAGMAIQSTSASLFILAGLSSTGSITVGQAISILTGFSVGNCLLPFLVTFKIRTAVFFLVGVASIFLYFSKSDRTLNVFSLLFGLGLIFLGIELMLDGVRPLRGEPWFSQMLDFANDWPGLTIIAGAGLGFLVESSTAVVVVAIGLAKGGALSGHEVFPLMYGAAVGSTMFKLVLGSTLTGTSRQLVRFVNLFNITGAVVFILLYYAELYLHLPLVMALTAAMTSDLAVQAAWAFLFMNLTAALIYCVLHKPLVAALERRFPASEEEALAKPQFLPRILPKAASVALDLIGLEQSRAFAQTASFLSTLSEKTARPDLAQRVAAWGMLDREIKTALAEVASLRIDPQAAQRHTILQTRQILLKQLAESTEELTTAIRQTRRIPEIASFSNSCLEAVDFLFQNAADLIHSDGTPDELYQDTLYGDRGSMINKLREAYLQKHHELPLKSYSRLMWLTVSVEKCVWLMDQILRAESK